jgi:predicted transcriptional regulator
MSVVEEVRRYAVRRYGNLISVGEPTFDARTKTWLAELKSDYPRIVHDDRSPNERILKFLSLRRLGMIKLGENLQPIEATPRQTCIENLSSFLDMWQERAERIIVRVSSDHFARINEAQWVLAKIGMLVSNLLQKEMILEEEIASHHPREEDKIRRYLRLLEGLDLVRPTDEGYTYGNLFAELRGQASSVQQFKIAVLSYVIRERYSTLRENFGISQLESFVHVDGCYYRPTLEAETLLYLTRESIIDHYTALYGRKSPLRIAYILGELVDAEALEHEDKYYFGNEGLFSKMLDLKSEMAELAPPRA